jgi:hypothetical protein
VRLGAVGEAVENDDDGAGLVRSVGHEGGSDDGVRETGYGEDCEVGLARDVVEVLLKERQVVEVRRGRDCVPFVAVRHERLRQVARARVRRSKGATGDESPEPEAGNLDRYPERRALHGTI